ncbi:hypothetical protein GCM10007063_30980 [Lentibacillus kapialis]|uniref:Uncharacterized protein n=1 Tax=Lentibacillus kapialis TaxID=340214 RepID=A0A917Q358_9BACI|nr:hypothetical protein [Lentibacillus kapialis]GGK06280.1 hypothetical protein GCM10007063_30980 [Lentibacillus kapialis]
MALEYNNSIPLHIQLKERIKQKILDGNHPMYGNGIGANLVKAEGVQLPVHLEKMTSLKPSILSGSAMPTIYQLVYNT